MAEVFLDALLDTLKLSPIILLVNILIEIIEHKVKSDRIKKFLTGRTAPLWAATAGLLPQCGFGVVAAHLFANKKLSLGTLFAVIIVTSDEAVSVLLGRPSSALKLIPLLAIKFVFAIAVGFLVDAILAARQKAVLSRGGHISSGDNEKTDPADMTSDDVASEEHEPLGCHHHEIVGVKEKDLWHTIKHPLLHTLSTLIFVLIINILLGIILYFVGEENLSAAMAQVKFLQPFIAAAIGLIPNCAASVAIAQMYALGHITLGAAVAGLSVSGGLSLAVLIKENKNMPQNVIIILSLYLMCSVLGVALSFVPA